MTDKPTYEELEIQIAELKKHNEQLRLKTAFIDKEKCDSEFLISKEQISEAYQYTRSLIEASLDPLVTINAAGKITDVNIATEKITGLSRENLLGTDFSNYFTEPEKARSGYQKVFEQGYVTDYPLTIRSITNKLTDVLYNASVYRNRQGEIIGVFAAARDITERKRAEQALQEAAIYSRMLIEINLDALVTISDKGEITDVNTATENITGLTREKLIGSDFSDYFTDPEKARAGYLKVFEVGIVKDYPLTIRHTLGQTIDVLYNASVYRNRQGEIIGVFAAARDITERKRAELIIKQQNEELKKLNADKDKFISILAHDLKNPFNSMLGFLKLLSDNVRKYNIDKIEYQINIVHQTTKHTFNLLEEILSWVRAQLGKFPYNPQNLNFSIICNEVITQLKQIAIDKQITIKSISTEQITVFADEKMLKTILRNLISNALKFTNKNGFINIYAEKTAEYIQITISDNGIGIDAQMKNNLFNISELQSSEGTEHEKGTGLGLLLCKEFVVKHNGKIWVESELGKGSDFKFTIPLCVD